MLRASLGFLAAPARLAGTAGLTLLAIGCPSDSTPVTEDTSSTGTSEGSSSGGSTTIDPDSSTTDDATTVDPDSSSSGDASSSSSSGPGFDGCGDGDIDDGELCDGDNLDGRDCASEDFVDGVLACNADCTLDTSGCNYACGDGDVQGDEQCEADDLDGATCITQGFEGGNLDCNADCTFDVTGCENYTCGDDLRAGPEVCDGIDLDGEDCLSQGFDSGALTCAADCSAFDTTGCFVCGDGVINGDEVCDGDDLGGENCVSLGADGGVLGCNADCTFDVAECTGCGNGDQDPGEACDGNDFGGVTCAGLGFDGGQPTCTAECTLDDVSCLGLHTFCTAPAAAIGPGAGALTQSTIPVAGLAGAVIDLDVIVDATHTAVGDLDIDVRHVDTDLSVSLADDQCGANDDIDATFDQDAANPPACGATPTISGAVLPLGDLEAYVGTVGPGNGTWELSVVDQVAGNGGTLDQWCVAITTGSDCATPFAAPSFDAVVTFPDAPLLNGTRMTIAFDGANYWSTGGGSADGDVLASHDLDGALLAYYQPNLDLRSAFTKGDSVGPVFLRAYGSPQITVQNAPGVYANDVTLVGGVLDDQSAVVWDEANEEFVAHFAGNVSRWDAAGASIGNVALSGWGVDVVGENAYPQDRGVAAACGYYLTYFNGTLSAWDADGNRVATTTLSGAGVSFDSYFSYSFAQGLFFVNDGPGLSWRGYDVL